MRFHIHKIVQYFKIKDSGLGCQGLCLDSDSTGRGLGLGLRLGDLTTTLIFYHQRRCTSSLIIIIMWTLIYILINQTCRFLEVQINEITHNTTCIIININAFVWNGMDPGMDIIHDTIHYHCYSFN